ncbi:MAG: hydrogenase expression protein HypE [Reyranellaceae bacterium]
MATLIATLSRGRLIGAHRPWPRAEIDAAAWAGIAGELAGGHWTLLDLWGENGAVHASVLEEPSLQIGVFTLACPDGHFPSIGAAHPAAIRLERSLDDLFGLAADGAVDRRPWLDHGRWPRRHPLAAQPQPPRPQPGYEFLPVEGEGLHQIPVGPVHAGIIEPGHFRFTANGETVVRLEARLGYVHRGLEGLMRGAKIDHGARLAGRASGDSTVAYAYAFARAVEAALGADAPPRAQWLRAIMAEMERLANHLGDIGAICNDASFALMHAHCGILRERVLRTAAACWGHRLMRDRIVPGGVTADLDPERIGLVRALVAELRRRFPPLVDLYDNTTSLQDRTVATGILRPELARRFGAGGYVGRASGRGFDARRMTGYFPYNLLRFEVPMRDEGDVNARVWIRIKEVEQSLGLIDQMLGQLPDGAVRVELPLRAGEGMALVEGFRGDVLARVRLGADGAIEHCRLRDPSWFQWPLLEAVVEGNIVADFPLCNKSFNCSYAGSDL